MNANFWTKFDKTYARLTPAEFARACEALATVIGVPNDKSDAFQQLVEKETGMGFYTAVREAHIRITKGA